MIAATMAKITQMPRTMPQVTGLRLNKSKPAPNRTFANSIFVPPLYKYILILQLYIRYIFLSTFLTKFFQKIKHLVACFCFL
jgi:hypothetical protein